MKVAALEGTGAGLTVNAVAPGWMRTPLADNQIRDHMRLRGISRDDVLASMIAETVGQPVRRGGLGRRADHVPGRPGRIGDQRRLHPGRHRHPRRLTSARPGRGFRARANLPAHCPPTVQTTMRLAAAISDPLTVPA